MDRPLSVSRSSVPPDLHETCGILAQKAEEPAHEPCPSSGHNRNRSSDPGTCSRAFHASARADFASARCTAYYHKAFTQHVPGMCPIRRHVFTRFCIRNRDAIGPETRKGWLAGQRFLVTSLLTLTTSGCVAPRAPVAVVDDLPRNFDAWFGGLPLRTPRRFIPPRPLSLYYGLSFLTARARCSALSDNQ